MTFLFIFKLEVCHILLIPLNATARDVYYAVQRLKTICIYYLFKKSESLNVAFILGHDLYGDEYQFVIRQLSDYIPEDENNPGKSSYTAYLEKRYRGKICDTIMKSSFIRMYVVGNEPYISNKWSRKLVASELDINHEHNLKYVERCSFIINQRVDPKFTGNLVPIFGTTWQMQTAVAKTLDTVRDDIFFQDILPRIHGCRENREMYINSQFYQQSLFNSGDMTRLSNEVCIQKYLSEKRNSIILLRFVQLNRQEVFLKKDKKLVTSQTQCCLIFDRIILKRLKLIQITFYCTVIFHLLTLFC
jgi:hypothetical protein